MQCSFVSIAQNGSGRWDVVLKKCSPIIPEAVVDYVTSKTNKMEGNFVDSKVAAAAARRFAEEKNLTFLEPGSCGVSYLSIRGKGLRDRGLMPILILPNKIIAGLVYPSDTDEAFAVGTKVGKRFNAPFIPIKNAQELSKSAL